MRLSVSEIAEFSRAATAGSLLSLRAEVNTRATLHSPVMILSACEIGMTSPFDEVEMLSITSQSLPPLVVLTFTTLPPLRSTHGSIPCWKDSLRRQDRQPPALGNPPKRSRWGGLM